MSDVFLQFLKFLENSNSYFADETSDDQKIRYVWKVNFKENHEIELLKCRIVESRVKDVMFENKSTMYSAES